MEEKTAWQVRLECAACKTGHAVKVCVCGFMVIFVALTLVYTVLNLAAVLFNG